jgi:hypothetical protein
MIDRSISPKEAELFRRSVPTIGFVAAMALAMLATPARAQTNIDQGKSSAEIFASDCAVCHKTTRGLADGKNSLMLSGFLREHYTASRDQAAALAAYVLASGGNGPAPPGQKPGAARATLEEPKTGEPKTGDAKTAAHPPHPPAAAKLERPKDEEAKPEGEVSPAAASQRSVPAKHEAPPAIASRSEKQEPEAAPSVQVPVSPTVAPVVGGPPTTAQAPDPDLNPAPNATTAGESQSSESAPVPRDAIPD